MNDSNAKNAEIELKHIQLELQNGRTHHFRHFVDQYFCYKHGYVSKYGNPKWSAIAFKEYVSIDAKNLKALLDAKGIKFELSDYFVHKEHTVPLQVITELLQDLGKKASINTIKELIDKYLMFATITKEEDQILRDAGLNAEMPEEYYDDNSALFDDPMARHKFVGIEIEKR